MSTANIRQRRDFLLLAMCCLSQACNMPSDVPVPSRKGELISIVSEIAPPVIRSCVARNVGTLSTEEWNRVVELPANENPTGSQTAHVAVEYVSGNCFENDDFDPEIANSRWPSPDVFISAIQSGELLQTYSLPLLQSLRPHRQIGSPLAKSNHPAAVPHSVTTCISRILWNDLFTNDSV